MCMDDDDIYSPTAVKTYLEEWNRIKEEGKLDIIGAIRTITQDEDGRIVSKSLLTSHSSVQEKTRPHLKAIINIMRDSKIGHAIELTLLMI